MSRNGLISSTCAINWTGASSLVWNIQGSKGETPIISRRYLDYMDHAMIGGGRFEIDSVTHVLTGVWWKERVLPARCDVRLMPAALDKNDMPTGKNLVVVAVVNGVLHIRMFDGNGKMVIDVDEKRLRDRARQIEGLKRQLAGLWPPHELTGSEKTSVGVAVSATVGYTVPVPGVRVGKAFIHRNSAAMPRVRLAGRPVYASDQGCGDRPDRSPDDYRSTSRLSDRGGSHAPAAR